MKVTITSKYGEMESFRTKPHTGVDLNFPNGSEIHSVHSGIVDKVVNYGDKNIGKGVFVKNEDGSTSIYGHLSDNTIVKEGQTVHEGDLIGLSGHSGHVVGKTGDHLHFAEKDTQGQFVDPTSHADTLIANSGHTPSSTVIDFFKERGKVNNYGGEDYNFFADTMFPYFMKEGKEFCLEAFQYLTFHLPEIMGAITLLAAGLVMLGVKLPKVGAWYGFSLIVSVFWRMTT